MIPYTKGEILMLESRISHFGSLVTLAALGLGLVFGLIAAPPAAAEEELPLRFNATAMNVGSPGPRGTARLDIVVNRWSSEEERAELMAALTGQSGRGSRELANALFRQEGVGTIREVQNVANELRYSRRIVGEDGQQIILATDRPLGFAETWRSSRTLDYNVTLVVLELDAEGRGEGVIMLGAEFAWDEDENQIVITHFSTQPIQLTSVRLR
jgi:hypothetical protein